MPNISVGDRVLLRLHPADPSITVYVAGIEREDDDSVCGLSVWSVGAVPVLLDGDSLRRCRLLAVLN